MARMTWLEFLQGWGQAQQLEATKQIARNTRKDRPKYQRLPDGTWGYPPEGPSQEVVEAFERGWRTGWEAGYKQAMEAKHAPVPS